MFMIMLCAIVLVRLGFTLHIGQTHHAQTMTID
jgi:hypothetical protein